VTESGPCPPTLVVCSVFAAEVEALWQIHWPALRIRVVRSMLHVCPARLGEQLEAIVEEERRSGRGVVLVYGDCYVGMRQLAAQPGVVLTKGANCAELLLGRERYRRDARDGAYFLLPEWAQRGERFFAHELGLDRANARGLMGDLHRLIVYLDTGMLPVPQEKLRAIADYCGLPWESRATPLDCLHSAISEALGRLDESVIAG